MGINKRKIDGNLVTIIIPFYNEEFCLEETLTQVIVKLNNNNIFFELVLINDGSTDKSEIIAINTINHFKIKQASLINFTRNFGKEAALSAGLKYSNGDVVIPMDADLQDPPEIIIEMIKKWEEGFDIVNAIRKERKGDPFFKKITAFFFYRLLSLLSDIDISKDTGDFRLLDKKVVQAILLLPERTKFMKGLYSWVGFKKTSIYFKRNPRLRSNSNLNYFYLINHAIDGITSFSRVPLKFVSSIGIFVSFISIIYAIYLVIKTIVLGVEVPGYASIIVAILFLGGIQLIGLGILGEYLGRVFQEVKNRPLYLISSEKKFLN